MQSDIFQKSALVLCGGRGTRFASVSTDPKILTKFGKTTFLDWLVEYLRANGFEKIYFSVGYKHEKIISYVSNKGFITPCDFIIEDEELGTGGAIKFALEKISSESIYVFNGDTFWSEAIPKELVQDCQSTNTLKVAVKKISLNVRYGDFLSCKEGIKIRRGSINAPIKNSNVFIGMAKVPYKFVDYCTEAKMSFEDVLQNYQGLVRTINYFGEMLDFGTPEAFKLLKNKGFK